MLEQNNYCKEFGAVIRQLRINAGFSQESFAAHADIHRTYMGGIERGERNPTLTNIIKIAQALNIKPEEIFKEMSNDTP